MTSVRREAKKAPGEVLAFRVRMRDNEYFRVVIFKTKRQLQHYARTVLNVKVGDTCEGLCSSWVAKSLSRGRIRMQPKCGEILLAKGCLGVGHVTHEVLHAVLAYAKRKKLNISKDAGMRSISNRWVSEEEETLCWWQGYMATEIYKALYAEKVL